MKKIVEKPWGHEEIWALTDNYVGKILFVKAGHRLSLQHHVTKEETLRVHSGVLLFESGSSVNSLVDIEMRPGDVVTIRPGTIHRMTGVTDCEVYEVSTTELDDVVRHIDDYGREGTSKP
jgi:mannose-6-phosphate isomerase